MPLAALKHAYDATLLENTATLVQVETALRNVTWFLPGRFKDAELASEGVYSALSLVSMYHDSIIARSLKTVRRLPVSPFSRKAEVGEGEGGTFPDDPLGGEPGLGMGEESPLPLPLPSDHSRYTEHFTRTSSVYASAGRTVVLLGYVQLLLEMVVVRGGKGGREAGRWRRWKMVLVIEGIKSVLRLVLLGKTKRAVLPFPLAQREIDPSVLVQPEASNDMETKNKKPDVVPRLISAFPIGAPPHRYITPLIPRLPEGYQSPPEDLLPTLSGWKEWVGEGMYASEGFVAVAVYVWLAASRRRRGEGVGMAELARGSAWTSGIPLVWVLVARALRRGRGEGMTPLLAETYAARDRGLVFHLVRGALWQRWARGRVMRVVGGLEGWWGVRLVAGIVRDHVELVDEYYYYTAT